MHTVTSELEKIGNNFNLPLLIHFLVSQTQMETKPICEQAQALSGIKYYLWLFCL